jgi:hypothetical protein
MKTFKTLIALSALLPVIVTAGCGDHSEEYLKALNKYYDNQCVIGVDLHDKSISPSDFMPGARAKSDKFPVDMGEKTVQAKLAEVLEKHGLVHIEKQMPKEKFEGITYIVTPTEKLKPYLDDQGTASFCLGAIRATKILSSKELGRQGDEQGVEVTYTVERVSPPTPEWIDELLNDRYSYIGALYVHSDQALLKGQTKDTVVLKDGEKEWKLFSFFK